MSSIKPGLNAGNSQPPASENTKLLNHVREVVTEILGLDSTVQATDTLKDLGADSIDIATLIVTLQEEFPNGNAIEESMLENIQTPAEITRLIENLSSS